MRHLASNRLAARAAIHSAELLDRTEALGNAIDRATRVVWLRLLDLLQGGQTFAHNFHAALAIIKDWPLVIAQEMILGLRKLYHVSHQDIAASTVEVLPLPYLRAIAPAPAEAFVEALLEDLDKPEQPGIVTIGPTALGVPKKLSKKKAKAIYKDLVFPAPDVSEVMRRLIPVVQPANWTAIGDDAKRMPQDLAHLIAGSMAQGKRPAETAKDIRPYFDGSRTRARRAARTFGMLVSNQGAFDAHEQLGDMLAGYQINATHDENTRPAHAARDGTIYYKEPEPGQLGMDQMPHPPLEADGSVAWN